MKETKISAEISSANQLKAAVNATLCLFYKVRNETAPTEGNAFDLQGSVFSLPNTLANN